MFNQARIIMQMGVMKMKKWNKYCIFLSCILFFIHAQAKEFESSDNLKTLFTTPIERKHLDEMRNSGYFSKQQDTNKSQSSIRMPITVDVRGIVIREVGSPVVWVNNGNTLKSETVDEGVRVRTEYIKTEPVSIPVRINQKTLKMKPGQQWQELDSKIREQYQIKDENSEPSGVVE